MAARLSRVLGVLVPWFNTVVEPDLAALRPAAVTNQTARFTLDAHVVDDIRATATKLLACRPDAFLVALATESFPNGLAMLTRTAEELAQAAGRPVFTASHASQAALRALGARRIAVVTPFDDTSNARVKDAFAAHGFDVVRIAGLACPDLDSIARVPEAEIRRIFRAADHADADALVQVGTGLPVLRLVADLERAHVKPVVACNAALYWQALRETGVADRIAGFGRLLADH